MEAFSEFFTTATGFPEPHGYQERLARDGLPSAVQAPTGTGKTGIILAWLWRRLHGPDAEGTPRRLIYALPQRALVEQVAGEAQRWLENLGLTDQVALHVVMGGEGATQRQWRLDMQQPAIVVGTVDSLVSKALNRGYGIGRAIYPIDFALVTNGAHWVIDEVQLCPESTTTLRQLAAFTSEMGTAEPFGLTCMSATIPEDLLQTVDNPAPVQDEIVQVRPEERTGELAVRLGAERTIRRLDEAPGDYPAIARAIRQRHRPGTLTIAVLNTVEAARQVYKGLATAESPVTLLHSRFRGAERVRLIERITATPGEQGQIIIATQVIEAGIDLNAALLFTEAAPWPSVAQRAGRCNRTGKLDDAEMLWLPPAKSAPYPDADIEAAIGELTALEGAAVTGKGLTSRDVAVTRTRVSMIRRPDLLNLFDTAPDLSGADIDVAPYVRDAEDLDAQVAWAVWESASADGRPPDDARAPAPLWRCRVPLAGVAAMAKRASVWRFDQSLGRWTRLTPADRARPGEVLVIAAKDGGYDVVTGFDAGARSVVPDSPEMAPKADLPAGGEDAFRDDSTNVALKHWQSLDEHSEAARQQAEMLLKAIRPDLPKLAGDAVVAAARAHDAGKAHPIWQHALCELAGPGEEERIGQGRPWAKSASKGRLRFEGGVKFRHELASLLLLDGPLTGLLDDAGDADLARYLVLAHHGKLRVQVREPGDPQPDVLAGLRDGDVAEIPPLLGHPPSQMQVDLERFRLGSERSWTRTALALRDRYRPFVLAYLETIVRIADWRASAGTELEMEGSTDE